MTIIFSECITFDHTKKQNDMTTLLTPSTEKRATELMLSGVEVMEAIKIALIEETNMIGSLITSGNRLTERGKIARDEMFNRFNLS